MVMRSLASLVLAVTAIIGCSSERQTPAGTTPLETSASSGSTGSGNMQALTTAEALAEQQADFGWGTAECPPLPAGVAVGFLRGDQLGELVLRDCEGNDFDLREVCGARAVWMSFAHGWCPHCRENGSNMERIHADAAAAGDLASLNIIVEDNDFDTPNELICSAWRSEYAQDRVLTLYDPTGASLVLWEQNATALNVMLDDSRVIADKLHTDVEDELRAALSSVLGD